MKEFEHIVEMTEDGNTFPAAGWNFGTEWEEECTERLWGYEQSGLTPAEIMSLQAKLEAAISDIPRECHLCRHDKVEDGKEPCIKCHRGSMWEWRGMTGDCNDKA